MISNVVAVMLTLSLPRLQVFIQLVVNYITKLIMKYAYGDGSRRSRVAPPWNQQGQNHQPAGTEMRPVGPQPVRPSPVRFGDELARESENFNAIVNESHAAQTLATRIITSYVIVGNDNDVGVMARDPLSIILAKARLFRRNFKQHPRTTSVFLTLAVLFFSIFTAYQVIAICANNIIGPPIVRSASPHVGSWFPDRLDDSYMSNTSIFPVANDLHTRITFQAVAYAEKCYGRIPSSGCSSFYTPRIDYTEIHNATCPFQSDMCLEGHSSAYELNTGFLDAKVLGINYDHTCKFRLRRRYSPLAVDDRFIQSSSIQNTYFRRVDYIYGDGLGTNGGNRSFSEIVRDPSVFPDDDISRYIIREIKGDILQHPGKQSIRQWIPELTVLDARVTLYFIRPVKLVYTKSSSDPIFPATVPSQRMRGGHILYSTPHQRSTVMACVDNIEIQHPSTFEIWNPRFQNISQLENPQWQIHGILSSLKMINMSYLQPELLESRFVGMAEHFNAPRRIQRFYSTPLDPEQWKLENRKMFDTRLALLQYYTLGIAQGLGHDVPRARNLLREKGVDATGIIIFTHSEWKNLKVEELALFLSLCIMLWLTTIRLGNQFLFWWLLGKLHAYLCKIIPFVAMIVHGSQDINLDRAVLRIEKIVGVAGRARG